MAHIRVTAAFWLVMWVCVAGGSVLPVVKRKMVSATEIPQLVPGDLLPKVTTERQLSSEKNVDQLTSDKITGKLQEEHKVLSPGRIQPKAGNTGQILASTQETTHIKKSANSDSLYNNAPKKLQMKLKRFKRQITDEDEDLANEESLLETKTLSNKREKRSRGLGYGQSIEDNQQYDDDDDDDDDDETQMYQPNYDKVGQDELPRGSSVSSEMKVWKPQRTSAKWKKLSASPRDRLRFPKLQPKRNRKSGMKFNPKTRTESRSKHNKSLEKRDFNDNELPSDPEILYQTEESQNGSAPIVSSIIKQQLQGQIKTQEKRAINLGYGQSIEESSNQQNKSQRNSCKQNSTASLETQPDKPNYRKAREAAKPRGPSYVPSVMELKKARAMLVKPKHTSVIDYNDDEQNPIASLEIQPDKPNCRNAWQYAKPRGPSYVPSVMELKKARAMLAKPKPQLKVSQNGKTIWKRGKKIGTVSTDQIKNLRTPPNSRQEWKMWN